MRDTPQDVPDAGGDFKHTPPGLLGVGGDSEHEEPGGCLLQRKRSNVCKPTRIHNCVYMCSEISESDKDHTRSAQVVRTTGKRAPLAKAFGDLITVDHKVLKTRE